MRARKGQERRHGSPFPRLQARSDSPRRHGAAGAPCSRWPPGAPSAPRSVPSAAPARAHTPSWGQTPAGAVKRAEPPQTATPYACPMGHVSRAGVGFRRCLVPSAPSLHARPAREAPDGETLGLTVRRRTPLRCPPGMHWPPGGQAPRLRLAPARGRPVSCRTNTNAIQGSTTALQALKWPFRRGDLAINHTLPWPDPGRGQNSASSSSSSSGSRKASAVHSTIGAQARTRSR